MMTISVSELRTNLRMVLELTVLYPDELAESGEKA